ncbi:MAG: Smr/MutS family protein [Desulfobacteraceae bacterium]
MFLETGKTVDSEPQKKPGKDEDAGEQPAREDFEELLDLYLKGKSADRILQEKSDRTDPAKVPLKRRLKRHPPPESVLDLHGFRGDSARLRADAYIKSARQKGLFTIRIIVGKGLHSEFGAVLPDIVEDVADRLKKEKVVLSYMWEKKKKSRSGSIIVYLNQFND